jgi:hypothetical protein
MSAPGITREEELWISRKLRQVDEAFEKVPVNEEVVRQVSIL